MICPSRLCQKLNKFEQRPYIVYRFAARHLQFTAFSPNMASVSYHIANLLEKVSYSTCRTGARHVLT